MIFLDAHFFVLDLKELLQKNSLKFLSKHQTGKTKINIFIPAALTKIIILFYLLLLDCNPQRNAKMK